MDLIEELTKNLEQINPIQIQIVKEIKRMLERLSELNLMYFIDNGSCIKRIEKWYEDKLNKVTSMTDSIKIEEEMVIFKMCKIRNESGFINDYIIKISLNNCNISIEGNKIKGTLCHPHINPNGTPCFGDLSSYDVARMFEEDIVGFLEYINSFLKYCNYSKAIHGWKEACVTEAVRR